VIGEFRPAKMRGGKREFLEAIPDYYPAVVKPETFATVQQLRKSRPSYRGRSGFNVFSHLAFDKGTGSPMVYVNKRRKTGAHYLVAFNGLNGQAPYRTWQYDEFLALFLTICQRAALAPQEKAATGDDKLALARMALDETEQKIARLVEFLADGHSAGVADKLRELEAKKTAQKSAVEDLESELLAKPADVAKVNWEDPVAFRENLRATVKRITVDAATKSFDAEFLDGREFTLKVDGRDAVLSRNGRKPIKVPLAFVLLCGRNAGFVK